MSASKKIIPIHFEFAYFSFFLTHLEMLMIYEVNHIWTAEINETEEMIVAVNAIYAIA